MPAGVKEAIARFYALNDSDDRSASVSEELASSIFTRDAECIVNKLVMKGKDGNVQRFWLFEPELGFLQTSPNSTEVEILSPVSVTRSTKSGH